MTMADNTPHAAPEEAALNEVPVETRLSYAQIITSLKGIPPCVALREILIRIARIQKEHDDTCPIPGRSIRSNMRTEIITLGQIHIAKLGDCIQENSSLRTAQEQLKEQLKKKETELEEKLQAESNAKKEAKRRESHLLSRLQDCATRLASCIKFFPKDAEHKNIRDSCKVIPTEQDDEDVRQILSRAGFSSL